MKIDRTISQLPIQLSSHKIGGSFALLNDVCFAGYGKPRQLPRSKDVIQVAIGITKRRNGRISRSVVAKRRAITGQPNRADLYRDVLEVTNLKAQVPATKRAAQQVSTSE